MSKEGSGVGGIAAAGALALLGLGGKACMHAAPRFAGEVAGPVSRSAAHAAESLGSSAGELAQAAGRSSGTWGSVAEDAQGTIGRSVEGFGDDSQREAARQSGSAADTVLAARPRTQPKLPNRDLLSSVLNNAQLKDAAGRLPGESIHARTIATFNAPDLDRIRAARPRLISFAPETDAEFHGIYGHEPSLAQARSVEKFSQARPRYGDHWGKEIISLDDLRTRIGMEPGEVLVLLAHSLDEGRVLRLAEDLSVEIDGLQRVCAELRKICLTLTCHSRDLGFTDEITLADALKIWELTEAWAATGLVPRSARQITDFMRSARQRQVARSQINLVWAGVGVAGGTVLYTSIIDEEAAG